MAALETSCKMTEKFWNVWREQYLTSLWEKHKLNVGRKKGCVQQSRKGALVLICETAIPRHSWKMGIIHERLIRRPINLLVPLELEDGISERRDVNTNTREKREDQATLSDRGNQEEQDPPEPRYNLRSRRKGGVTLESDEGMPYEICGNQLCMMVINPNIVENVTFPPEKNGPFLEKGGNKEQRDDHQRTKKSEDKELPPGERSFPQKEGNREQKGNHQRSERREDKESRERLQRTLEE
ncbi:hypothetical protein GCK32_009859 [Trichostrongylus colubriformis]|uniref:DUF5641 domain-containing protein n=1 Tax=Trichostrongylus colubriformis TaxID=6319 RepID=A0AAN8III9_TRICO